MCSCCPTSFCNSGGVVVSYFEWVQGLQQFFWDEAEVLERLIACSNGRFKSPPKG